MNGRRVFLKHSAIVSLAPCIPTFLKRSLSAAETKPDDRILVIIQLDGGNDGLNTVIPFQDELYKKHRPSLQIDASRVLKIDSELGLNPTMRSAADLLEDGRLAIVQNVGYPNPNRSHFQSMAIWHHGQPDLERHDSLGWVGKTLDSRHASAGHAHSLFVGDIEVPVALLGRRSQVVAIAEESDLASFSVPQHAGVQLEDELSSFVSKSFESSYDAVRKFQKLRQTETTGVQYPTASFGQRMKLISQMIKINNGASVFYVSQPGYDTHAGQSIPHGQLLGLLSDSLKAFLDDMRDSGLEDRIAVLCFSEFGRRVQENSAQGTDHGAAGPVFIAGRGVLGGLHGSAPNLSGLANGDLKHQFDFRQVYTSLLNRWLNMDASNVFEETYQEIDLFRT